MREKKYDNNKRDKSRKKVEEIKKERKGEKERGDKK